LRRSSGFDNHTMSVGNGSSSSVQVHPDVRLEIGSHSLARAGFLISEGEGSNLSETTVLRFVINDQQSQRPKFYVASLFHLRRSSAMCQANGSISFGQTDLTSEVCIQAILAELTYCDACDGD
jgi:hypothetical protein